MIPRKDPNSLIRVLDLWITATGICLPSHEVDVQFKMLYSFELPKHLAAHVLTT